MTINEWYDVARDEIFSMIECGIKPSRESLIDELEPLCRDPEVKASFDCEGGFMLYIDTLWYYMDDILTKALEECNYE